MNGPDQNQVNWRDHGYLFFLTLLSILNFVDRQLLVSMANYIVPDLNLSNTQFGLLTGAVFITFYAVMGMFAGVLADRVHRPRLIAAGLLLWSALTAASGAARGFVSLALPRAFVGVGESVCTPTSMSLLADRFPASRLGYASSVYYAGVPIGNGLSLLLVRYLADPLGWRSCFYILGALGVVVAIGMFFMREVPRRTQVQVDVGPEEGSPPVAEAFAILIHALRQSPALSLVILGGVVLHIGLAIGFFEQLWLARERGFDRAWIAGVSGFISIFAGLAGNVAGGPGSDWFQNRTGTGRPMFVFWVLLLTAPLVFAYRLVDPANPIFWIGMCTIYFSLGCLYGPVFSTVQELSPPKIRAMSVAFLILSLNVFGLIIGGTLGGFVIDGFIRAGLEQPYTVTMVIFSSVWVLAMPMFYMSGKRFYGDRDRLYARLAEG